VGDGGRTADLEQLPWAQTLSEPRRLASAAGSVLRHGGHYGAQSASIVTGGSPIQPEKGDRRFADPAFTDHLIDRRVMQAS
jgi:polyhydroxyalkanoate synthase